MHDGSRGQEFMLDAGDDEDYNFDYEDDDDENGGEADVENEYYVAKGSTLPLKRFSSG